MVCSQETQSDTPRGPVPGPSPTRPNPPPITTAGTRSRIHISLLLHTQLQSASAFPPGSARGVALRLLGKTKRKHASRSEGRRLVQLVLLTGRAAAGLPPPVLPPLPLGPRRVASGCTGRSSPRPPNRPGHHARPGPPHLAPRPRSGTRRLCARAGRPARVRRAARAHTRRPEPGLPRLPGLRGVRPLSLAVNRSC